MLEKKQLCSKIMANLGNVQSKWLEIKPFVSHSCTIQSPHFPAPKNRWPEPGGSGHLGHFHFPTSDLQCLLLAGGTSFSKIESSSSRVAENRLSGDKGDPNF